MIQFPFFSTLLLFSATTALTVLPSESGFRPEPSISRRVLLATLLGTAAATPFAAQVAHAADDEAVYFGAGCFWHMQHEFIQAERDLLGRDLDTQLSATAGYAGGTKTDGQGRVCYHNFQNVADYGRLGHGEVVGLTLPSDKIAEFGKVYFSLLDPKTKDRVDPMDRGAEYRSLLGLPGGTSHPAYPGIQEAAQAAGVTLKRGQGNDGDTLGKKLVWVYDTQTFPFYQAEVYHQYHNDFQSAPYGKAYNQMGSQAFEDGRLKLTGCPDRV
jgi:peptide methionine sulfoxide reductase MsrA